MSVLIYEQSGRRTIYYPDAVTTKTTTTVEYRDFELT